MKYSEFHRIILKAGWIKVSQKGSHIFYKRNESDTKKIPVPFHGAKEINEKLRKKIAKDMGLH